MGEAREARWRRGAFTVGSVRGVPIRVHWTLLLALPYLALAFVAQLSRGGERPLAPAEAWVLGLALAIALFAGVALHELGHTLLGMRLGARVRGITLLFLGGVSEMSRAPSTAGREVAMAIAGPATSLALAAVAYGVEQLLHGMPARVVGTFAGVNLAIAVFNLLPAFPLDGGRVLRGALVRPLGRARATRVAAGVGRVMALLLAIGGLLAGNLILVVIAGFVYFGAGAEEAATRVEARLAGVRVADVADPTVAAVDVHASAQEAAAAMAARRQPVLLVLRNGHVVGQLPADRLRALPIGYRAHTPVAQLMIATPAAAQPDEPATAALRRMADLGLEVLPVLEGERLIGVLRRDEVMRFVELRELDPAAR